MSFLLYKLLPRLVFAIVFVLSGTLVFAQVRIYRPSTSTRAYHTQRITTDTLPVKRRVIISRDIVVNPRLINSLHSTSAIDTVYDLRPYLQSKAGCDFEKTIDTDGCVIVKYADGLIKKVCDGTITEVIMPDGRKHVSKWGKMGFMLYVVEIPAPPSPATGDLSYAWLTKYNNELLVDIQKYLGNNAGLISQYMKQEQKDCEKNLYRQIEYRTIFLEEFLSAK